MFKQPLFSLYGRFMPSRALCATLSLVTQLKALGGWDSDSTPAGSQVSMFFTGSPAQSPFRDRKSACLDPSSKARSTQDRTHTLLLQGSKGCRTWGPRHPANTWGEGQRARMRGRRDLQAQCGVHQGWSLSPFSDPGERGASSSVWCWGTSWRMGINTRVRRRAPLASLVQSLWALPSLVVLGLQSPPPRPPGLRRHRLPTAAAAPPPPPGDSLSWDSPSAARPSPGTRAAGGKPRASLLLP